MGLRADDLTDAQLDELLAKSKPPLPKAEGLSDTELDAMLAESEPVGKITTGLRALDFPGGVVRTLVADIAEEFIGKDLVKPEEAERALRFKGDFPSTAEFLERAGISKLGTIDLPFIGEISRRGVIGFLGDVLTDPTSLIGLGVAKAGGRALVASSVKRLEGVARAFKKSDVADTLIRNKILGNAQELPNQIVATTQRLGAEIEDIGIQVSRKNPNLRIDRETIKKELREEILNPREISNRISNEQTRFLDEIIDEATDIPNPIKRNILNDNLENFVELTAGEQDEVIRIFKQFPAKAKNIQTQLTNDLPGVRIGLDEITKAKNALDKELPLTIERALGAKQQISSALKSSDFKIGAATVNFDKAISKAVAGKIGDAVKSSIATVDPAIAKRLNIINKDFSMLKTIEKKAQELASSDLRDEFISSIDAGLFGLSLFNPASGAFLAGKKIFDVTKSPNQRRALGRFLINHPSIAPAIQRAAINAARTLQGEKDGQR